MPHFILEYSARLDKELQLGSLMEKLRDTVVATDIFPDIREFGVSLASSRLQPPP